MTRFPPLPSLGARVKATTTDRYAAMEGVVVGYGVVHSAHFESPGASDTETYPVIIVDFGTTYSGMNVTVMAQGFHVLKRGEDIP